MLLNNEKEISKTVEKLVELRGEICKEILSLRSQCKFYDDDWEVEQSIKENEDEAQEHG